MKLRTKVLNILVDEEISTDSNQSDVEELMDSQ